MNILVTAIAFLVILGVLVFVHELGHFIAAKSAGVYVETFSIGMGPKLLKKQWGDTEYCLSAIPLGGYVKLKGENPDEVSSNDPDNMMNKSIPRRFSIFIAGPVMNIVLAVILVSLVFYIGIQVPKYMEEPPIIGWIEEGSPAEANGLRIGDEILMVGGESMKTWEQTILYIASTGGKSLEIEVDRDGIQHMVTIVPDVDNSIGAGDIGIGPVMKATVGGIVKGYPADEAGLQAGDEIVAIDGAPIVHWIQMSRLVNASPEKTLRLTVLRDGQELEIDVTPRREEDGKGYLGIQSQQQTVLKKYGVIESISRGTARCWELTTMTIDLLKRLVTLKASAKTVGGPIMIAQMSGQVVREGLSESLSFMGLISLSLGIFNLLPIPILDGGHIFLLIVEILYRRPLKMKEREFAQKIGLLIIIPLMIFVFYNDIMRIVGW